MLKELELHIQARYPLIYLVSWEEDRVIREIQKICDDENHKKRLYLWSETQGLQLAALPDKPSDLSLSDPLNILDHIIKSRENGGRQIYILLDFHPFLSNHTIIRKVRDLGKVLRKSEKTVIFLSPKLVLPDELAKEVVVFDFDLPSLEQLSEALDGIVEALQRKFNITTKLKNPAFRERLLKASQGLTILEMSDAIAKAVVAYQAIDESTIPLILEEKKQIIRKSGILEYYPAEETFDEVGGLGNLKRWLSKRDKAFTEEARHFGVPVPKGLMLVGVQGCGKSLCAKAVANQWRLPLLRLDVGKVFSGLVGSSEENIRKAIKIAESVAPCLLWIDEIEKGLSGAASSNFSDAGTAARVFATFTTWLQEKTKPVFVISTANDISLLPPEIMRKGRFDEIFFVDLPNLEERIEIFRIHLSKRKRDPREFDLEFLAQYADGFSGAEIEQAIISALYDAFEEERPLTTDDILRNIKETVPLSRTMAERISALRRWAESRARYASGDYPSVNEVPKEEASVSLQSRKDPRKRGSIGNSQE
jgi:ATP-dependent 26S proteasome regulatory subunit